MRFMQGLKEWRWWFAAFGLLIVLVFTTVWGPTFLWQFVFSALMVWWGCERKRSPRPNMVPVILSWFGFLFVIALYPQEARLCAFVGQILGTFLVLILWRPSAESDPWMRPPPRDGEPIDDGVDQRLAA